MNETTKTTIAALVLMALAASSALGQASLKASGRIETEDQLVSTVANGTPPLEVTSTTRVNHLNADLVDGFDGALLDLRLSNVEQGVEALQLLRTHIVSPIGTPLQNGNELLMKLAAIPTPASQEQAQLLKIEPGLYDLGAQTLSMRPWIDVEGSGQETTLITGTNCAAFPPSSGVITGAAKAELRMLTVRNTCSSATDSANAFYNTANGARLRDVTVVASGAAVINTAIYNEGLDVVLMDLVAVSSGASSANRAVADGGGRTRMIDIEATATGGSESTAIELFGGEHLLIDVRATARDGTSDTYGVWNAGSNASFHDLVATSSSTTGKRFGIWATEGGFRMEGGIAEGYDGMVIERSSGATTTVLQNATINGTRYGLQSTSPSIGPGLDLFVNHCTISGATNTVSNSDSDVFIGASQLAGGTVSGTGVTCAGVFDESYNFSSNTCP